MEIFYPILSKETVDHSAKPALLIHRDIRTVAEDGKGAVLGLGVDFISRIRVR